MPSEVSKEMKAPYSMSRETCALATAKMSLRMDGILTSNLPAVS